MRNPWAIRTPGFEGCEIAGSDDRMQVVRATDDVAKLREIIEWPGTGRTVRLAAESKLRRLARKAPRASANKESLHPLTGSAWDDAYAGLRAVKDKAHIPNEHSVALRDACRDMQEGIRKMLAYSPIRGERDEANDLRRLNERMERICELSNIQECGSLMIEIEHAMQAAYRRMP